MSAPLLPAPWMYGRRKLTRVEVALYAVIAAVLASVFMSYALDCMELAEKSAMQTTLGNVTAGINLQYAKRLMAGGAADRDAWLARNPFALAHAAPPGYLGESEGVDIAHVSRPAWLFDPARHEILYLPKLRRHLQGPDPLRFRLQLHPSGFGFVLAPTSPFLWGSRSVEKNSQIAFRIPHTPLFS